MKIFLTIKSFVKIIRTYTQTQGCYTDPYFFLHVSECRARFYFALNFFLVSLRAVCNEIEIFSNFFSNFTIKENYNKIFK